MPRPQPRPKVADWVGQVIALDPCHGEAEATGADGQPFQADVCDVVLFGEYEQFDPGLTVEETTLHREVWITQQALRRGLSYCTDDDRWLVGLLTQKGRAYELADLSDAEYDLVVKLLAEIDRERL